MARSKKKRPLKSGSRLPEPLPEPWNLRSQTICAGAVFVVTLAVYWLTLAPTVTLVDSGELILAAHSLGVAHPPGFPLYLLLAHLASLVPIGNVALRVNFASALFAAASAGMMTLVAGEAAVMAGLRCWMRIVVALCAGLLLAFGHTLWAYGTIAEVYTLNAFLILLILWLMLRWRREPARDSWLHAAAGVFGLALGVHHVTVAAILPGIAVLVWRTEGARFYASRRLLWAALISFAALIAIYAYLPIAAAREPVMNWGNPRTLVGVWRHISGRQYQAYLSFTPSMLGENFRSGVHLLLREFGPLWLPLALATVASGGWFSWRRNRTIFWLLALIVLVNVGYNLSYSIAEDKDAYYLPTFIACAAFAGLGLGSLGKRLPLAAGVALLLPAIALAANWRSNDRSGYFIAQDYVHNIERTIAPDGLLLTLDWQVQSPMFYTREIEGRRRDIKVIDINLLRRSWYFDYLRRAFPEMIERSRATVDAFTEELRQWENDPGSYARDAARTERITALFTALCETFVRNESAVAPVYLTSDVLLASAPETVSFTQWLGTNYEPVPRGLLFQLLTERGFHDPGELQLELDGLAEARQRFEPDDVVNQKVLPAYEIMLVNRGRYLAAAGQDERAAEAFRLALDLNPELQVAREGLEASLAKRSGR